jgi:hypothetical protein
MFSLQPPRHIPTLPDLKAAYSGPEQEWYAGWGVRHRGGLDWWAARSPRTNFNRDTSILGQPVR